MPTQNLDFFLEKVGKLNNKQLEDNATILEELAKFKDIRVTNAFIKILRETSDVDCFFDIIYDYFKACKDPEHVQLLIDALKNSSTETKVSIIYLLEAVTISKAKVLKTLISILKEGENDIRWAAAAVLSEIADPHSVEPLIELLKSSDIGVRTATVYALGEIRDSRAVEPLIKLLKDDVSSVRCGAIYALGKINDCLAIDAIISVLNDNDDDVRQTAKRVLEC